MLADHRHFWQIKFRTFNVHAGRGSDRGWYEFFCRDRSCSERYSIAADKFWGTQPIRRNPDRRYEGLTCPECVLLRRIPHGNLFWQSEINAYECTMEDHFYKEPELTPIFASTFRNRTPHTHGGTDAPECTPYGQRCGGADSLGESNTEVLFKRIRKTRSRA